MMDQIEMLELSREFAGLAAQIAGPGDNEAYLRRLVELAVKTVHGCRYATVSVLRGKQSQLLIASEEVGERLEQLQNELDEGPSLAAVRLDQDLVIQNLSRETRWPRFAEVAVRTAGVQSVLAFRLAGVHPSVLTLYGDEPAGFAEAAVHNATIFAAQAGTLVALVAAEDHSANLETALQSSREIGMALGILMAHRKITHEHAFDLLRSASQNLHRKLRDVAAEVMETGTLPDLPPRRLEH
jgi:hypothetical protein